MTPDERTELAEIIAGELEDSGYGIDTEGGREVTAGLIVDRIERDLTGLGWQPPAQTHRLSQAIDGWAQRLGKIPAHLLTPDTITSHLSELAQIRRP